MKKTILQRIKDKINKRNHQSVVEGGLRDEYDLYVESYFLNLLCYERKRAERSGRQIVLMLLNIGNTLDRGERVRLIKKIVQVLYSSTRDIDIKGWYRHDTEIGIIFTELNGTDKITLKKKILEKLYENLHRDVISKIDISAHLFPDGNDSDNDNNSDDENCSCDSIFYPERDKRNRKVSIIIKRILDITGSLTGLILFAPLFIVISLIVKFTSPGPVFFKQERIGEGGKKFTFLKFRSMYVNSDHAIHKEYIKKLIKEQKSYSEEKGEKQLSAIYKIKDDPRVTPIGRFLRKTSLDELPQFINVLKGEMSLVGPRPPIPYEIENYNPWHRRRIMEVKPGITGLWQVYGRSSTTFNEMVRLDLRYVREWSIWLDLKILVQTPYVVFVGKGAY